MTVHQTCARVGPSPSAVYLSDLEASQQSVESYLVALETIMGGELSDIGHLCGARLRLRQANLARTCIALDACRHLLTDRHSQQSLRDLQLSELKVSQLISVHVQCWTTKALQDDWEGYCRETTKVLDRVRELIAAEKKLLCRMLRQSVDEHRSR